MAPIVRVKKKKKERRHFLIMMHQRRQQPQVFLCLSHSIVPSNPGGEQDWRVKKPDHPPPPSNMPLVPTQQAEMKAETQGNLTCRPRVTIHFFSYWPTAKDDCSFLRRMGAARYTVTSAPIIPCKRVRLSLQRKLPTLVQIPQVTYMFPRLLCGLVINHQTGKWWALISPLET